jgi:uncharacterized protein YkwD
MLMSLSLHVLQLLPMRTRPLIICLALLLVFAATAHAQDESGDLLARVNALRTSLGLSPYSFNGILSAAAQGQAQWMVDTGNISHSRPDGSTPRSRAQAAGYPSTFVSENIYGGTNAGVNDAWNFWINSAIHYAGLTNPNYQDIGIGVAHGAWGATYVLVFGNPAGTPILPPQASGGQNASSGQPSYVVGLDANGNIMHEIQPGDTLGDIALIYGYTWDDIPYMMQLNGLADVRDLDIGSILLVPPYGGTYTPTPDDAPTTPDTSATTSADAATTPVDLGIITPTQPAPTLTLIPTNILLPTPQASTPTVVQVASVPTDSATLLTVSSGGTITPGAQSPWLTIALVVQVGILVAAGVEFIRRSRR